MHPSHLKTFGRQRSLRIKGFDYSLPYAYFVTNCTHRKKRYFESRQLAQVVKDLILELRSDLDYRVYCYCIMPDHVHLLINPADSKIGLPRFIRLLKSKAAVRLLKGESIGQLWQRGYYEHILRKSEDLSEIAGYILNNPIRKGIVSDFGEYEFSGIVDELV